MGARGTAHANEGGDTQTACSVDVTRLPQGKSPDHPQIDGPMLMSVVGHVGLPRKPRAGRETHKRSAGGCNAAAVRTLAWGTLANTKDGTTMKTMVTRAMTAMASLTARRKAVNAAGLVAVEVQVPHGGRICGSASTRNRLRALFVFALACSLPTPSLAQVTTAPGEIGRA